MELYDLFNNPTIGSYEIQAYDVDCNLKFTCSGDEYLDLPEEYDYLEYSHVNWLYAKDNVLIIEIDYYELEKE